MKRVRGKIQATKPQQGSRVDDYRVIQNVLHRSAART